MSVPRTLRVAGAVHDLLTVGKRPPPGGQRKKGKAGIFGGTQRYEPKPGHRYQTMSEAVKHGPSLGYPKAGAHNRQVFHQTKNNLGAHKY